MTRGTSKERRAWTADKIRLDAAEQALADERRLTADLMKQLDRANAAAVRMAKRAASVEQRRAA